MTSTICDGANFLRHTLLRTSPLLTCRVLIEDLILSDHMIFGEILVQRPLARETLHLPSQLTDKDFEYMRLKAKHHFDEIMHVLRNMPQALLLIIRYVLVLFQSSVQKLLWEDLRSALVVTAVEPV